MPICRVYFYQNVDSIPFTLLSIAQLFNFNRVVADLFWIHRHNVILINTKQIGVGYSGI